MSNHGFKKQENYRHGHQGARYPRGSMASQTGGMGVNTQGKHFLTSAIRCVYRSFDVHLAVAGGTHSGLDTCILNPIMPSAGSLLLSNHLFSWGDFKVNRIRAENNEVMYGKNYSWVRSRAINLNTCLHSLKIVDFEIWSEFLNAFKKLKRWHWWSALYHRTRKGFDVQPWIQVR